MVGQDFTVVVKEDSCVYLTKIKNSNEYVIGSIAPECRVDIYRGISFYNLHGKTVKILRVESTSNASLVANVEVV
jgi:O-glycosyl hydrolase